MPSERRGSGCSAQPFDRFAHGRRYQGVGALQRVQKRGVFVSVGDLVETEHRRLLRAVEVAEADVQAMRPLVACTSDVDAGGRCRVPCAHVVPDAVAQFREADEIRVGVEDHDAERRLGEQTLEDRPEGVGLARARLAAEERVAVERSGVESERDALGESERAHIEHRPGRSHGVQPARDLGRGRHTSRSRVEGPVRPLEEPALDAHRRGGAPGPALERNGRHVPEAVVADEDVVPDAHVEAIRRDVIGEMPSVHRCRGQCGLRAPGRGIGAA